MTLTLAQLIGEIITDTKIICDNCGWSWNKEDGGDDLYMCHKCDHNNMPQALENFKDGKVKEVFTPSPLQNLVNDYLFLVTMNFTHIETNWIFSLQKSISKLIFAGYTGSKNPVRNRLKIQFVKLDFSKLIFQKSSTDQQGEGILDSNQTPWRNSKEST